MWTVIFFGLLLIALATFIAFFFLQRREIANLKRNVEAVQQEEHRVFDFLHGLGEAFSEKLKNDDLYRLIVSGAVKILDAHGGALYLADKTNTCLVAIYISEGCPPLATVPAHILEQASITPIALESYLRLHAVERGQGLLGEVWATERPMLLPETEGDRRLEFLSNPSVKSESAMIAPLIYGSQNLGVLAVANGPIGRKFSKSDFEVFRAITEQSAFALYNAFIYAEVGEKKRLDNDLQTAKEIQSILLPSDSPKIEGFDISGCTLPARLVSGDYYDYIRIDDQRTGFVIADVSGKGVPASLIMAMCRSVLRSQSIGNASPSDVLSKVNRQLYPDIKEDMFISMAYVILDHASQTLQLCRAGHDAPLLYRASDQSVTKLNPKGMAIGIDSGDVFNRVIGDFSVSLEKGDCLLLYTDGVTEAVDRKGFEFGLKRMTQSLQSSAMEGSAAVIRRLTGELRDFVGDQPQYDDVTLVAICKL